MKHSRLAFFFFLIIFTTTLSIFAEENPKSLFYSDNWRFDFGIPLYYQFKTAADGESLQTSRLPAGLLIYLRSPHHIGTGFEYYEIPLESLKNQSGTRGRVTRTMVDLYYEITFSYASIAFGGGIGTSVIKGDYAHLFNPTSSSQVFLKIGGSIPELINIHFTLHRIFAEVEFKHNNYFLETGGFMAGLSFGVEF